MKICAESEGFEPPDLLQSTVFKTAAFDHSANFPCAKVQQFLFLPSLVMFFLSHNMLTHSYDFVFQKSNFTFIFIFCLLTSFFYSISNQILIKNSIFAKKFKVETTSKNIKYGKERIIKRCCKAYRH